MVAEAVYMRVKTQEREEQRKADLREKRKDVGHLHAHAGN